jgi:3-deoxy-D-manno-octulosonic-acid transferase
MRIGDLMKDPANRKAAGDAAFRTVDRLGGALGRTFTELEPYLMQLRLTYQASNA